MDSKNNPYILINLIFAGIILSVFIYSGIFSAENNNHPVPSACEIILKKDCPTTGLSRSFSEIVRFRIKSAKEYNSYGPRIFLFFFVQLFLRIIFCVLALKASSNQKYIVTFDSIISIAIYIYSFAPLIIV